MMNIVKRMWLSLLSFILLGVVSANPSIDDSRISEYTTPDTLEFVKSANKNLLKIPTWQIEIYKKHNIDYEKFLTMAMIKNLECSREDGGCDNWSDSWPFQVNIVHWELYQYYKNLIKEKKYYRMFEEQIMFISDRMDRLENSVCSYAKGDVWEMRKCQMINHNGNNKNGFKYNYAKRGIALAKSMEKYKLREFYNAYNNSIDIKYLPFQQNIDRNLNEMIRKINNKRELKIIQKNAIEKEKENLQILTFCGDALKWYQEWQDELTFNYYKEKISQIGKQRKEEIRIIQEQLSLY